MSPEIYQFMDPLGHIDYNRWHHDICGRLITDHIGPDNGISTPDLCMLYFGYYDLERRFLVEQQMQTVRFMLEHRQQPMLLRSHHRLWYVVATDDTEGARGFVAERAKRFVRSGVRLNRSSNIAQQTYQLSQGDPLVKAIEGAAPAIHQIEEAIEPPEPPQPPEGNEED